LTCVKIAIKFTTLYVHVRYGHHFKCQKGLDELIAYASITPKRNVTFIMQRNAKFSFLMINVTTKDYGNGK
jgi:hypothetical protein